MLPIAALAAAQQSHLAECHTCECVEHISTAPNAICRCACCGARCGGTGCPAVGVWAELCAVHQKRTSMRSSRSLASKPTCALAPRAKRARGCWAARASSASRHRDRRPPARPPSLVVSGLAMSFPFSNPDGSAQLQRYCLEHAMPEIHGCADDAKAHARNAWLLDSSKKLAAEQARCLLPPRSAPQC